MLLLMLPERCFSGCCKVVAATCILLVLPGDVQEHCYIRLNSFSFLSEEECMNRALELSSILEAGDTHSVLREKAARASLFWEGMSSRASSLAVAASAAGELCHKDVKKYHASLGGNFRSRDYICFST